MEIKGDSRSALPWGDKGRMFCTMSACIHASSTIGLYLPLSPFISLSLLKRISAAKIRIIRRIAKSLARVFLFFFH